MLTGPAPSREIQPFIKPYTRVAVVLRMYTLKSVFYLVLPIKVKYMNTWSCSTRA